MSSQFLLLLLTRQRTLISCQFGSACSVRLPSSYVSSLPHQYHKALCMQTSASYLPTLFASNGSTLHSEFSVFLAGNQQVFLHYLQKLQSFSLFVNKNAFPMSCFHHMSFIHIILSFRPIITQTYSFSTPP